MLFYVKDLKKTSNHIYWLTCTYGALASSGLAVNIIIAVFYDKNALGLFNLTYSFYILISQFAVFGFHYAALYFNSVNKDLNNFNYISIACLVCGFISSTIFIFLLYFLKSTFASIMDSPYLFNSLQFICIALMFFTLNKILLNILNALRIIKIYAIGLLIRYISIIIYLLTISLLSFPSWSLPSVFIISELCCFIYLFIYCRKLITWNISYLNLLNWIIKILKYSIYALPIGVIVEINTRIDILIIGYYYSDSDIGLYSFVALLAEGLGQIPQLGKIYYDPRIAKLWSENRIESLSYLIFKSRFFWWSFMALICIFAYYFFIKLVIYIPNGIFYLNSAPIFAILLLSIFLSSGYIPFSGILQQTGYPERQSLHIISIFCINLMSNLIFVPVLGLFGSALGMLITQICLILLLRFFVKYTLKIVI